MSNEPIDLVACATGGIVNEALKDCSSDRERFQVTFWLLNHLKYMDRPASSGWRRTAERLGTMGSDKIENEVAKLFTKSFNKTCLRGWQDLVIAVIAVYASIQYNIDNSERVIERLIDNATSEKNKIATEKWTYVQKTLLAEDSKSSTAVNLLESMCIEFANAINKNNSTGSALRMLDALPYGPQAETKEAKRTREAQQKLASADDDDF